MRAVWLPFAQGLAAPGCGARVGWTGFAAEFEPAVLEVAAGALVPEVRDISTTATMTATSTPPMMMKGRELFDCCLGLRLIGKDTVREILYDPGTPDAAGTMVTLAAAPVETGGARGAGAQV